MLTRVLTASIGIPLLIGLIVIGNPILQLAASIIALIGVYEFYHILKVKYKPMIYLGYAATIVYFTGFSMWQEFYILFIAIWLSAVLIAMVIKHPQYTVADIAISFIGPIYVGLPLSFILMIRDFQYGDFFVWLIFISAWGSDTFAYIVGKSIGRHKLAPELSQNKTIEGSIGGLVGAGILAYIYTYSYTLYSYSHLTQFSVYIIATVIGGALISQVGDLVASAIKRQVNAKDFGYLFPGHGGVLDRFDSILLVAPFIMVILTIGQRIF